MSPEALKFIKMIDSAISQADAYGFVGTADALRKTLRELSQETQGIVPVSDQLTSQNIPVVIH
jgi:hypothetical protein